ncbi:MAG: S8 family serine peptidase [Terracidiphilus sp.]
MPVVLLELEGREYQSTGAAPVSEDKVVYSIDRDLLRFAKYAGVCLLVLLVVGIVLYLYGFHISKLPPKPDQVTYSFILDADLVRFAKFAASVLAIFFTVGVFLYGFEIKRAAREARDSADSTRQARYDVGKAKDEMAKDQEQSKQLLEQTEQLIASARERTQSAKDEIEKTLVDVRQQIQTLQSEVQITKTMIQTTNQEMQSLLESALAKTQAIDRSYESAAQKNKSAERKEKPGRTKKGRDEAYTVSELVRLYNFPQEFDGQKQCIGLIELGGGYLDSDMDTYFDELNIPKPQISLVPVDGAVNDPEGPGASQVTLDIEVAGACAPGARLVVYLAPNTTNGFINAITTATNDKENRPTILSIAWGASEDSWDKRGLAALNRAFQDAALSGITVLCAAGDGGVTDGHQDAQPHVDFPASSPWVLACGGTRLLRSGETIASETVWNDGDGVATGGGVSETFVKPDWQSWVSAPVSPAGAPGRAIPDVAAHASTTPGYSIIHRGNKVIAGGTSATTPLWAGLIARINQGLDRNDGVDRNLGYFNPVLYQKFGPMGVFRDIVQGDNGTKDVKGYPAGPGWDAASGWGSPDGRKLLEALRAETDAKVR